MTGKKAKKIGSLSAACKGKVYIYLKKGLRNCLLLCLYLIIGDVYKCYQRLKNYSFNFAQNDDAFLVQCHD